MLTVVHDARSSNEDAGGESLLDEIVRDGARRRPNDDPTTWAAMLRLTAEQRGFDASRAFFWPLCVYEETLLSRWAAAAKRPGTRRVRAAISFGALERGWELGFSTNSFTGVKRPLGNSVVTL